MDTRQLGNKVVNSILTIVRGPAFLSAISLVLLLATIPANATLLKGYLTQEAVKIAPVDHIATTRDRHHDAVNREDTHTPQSASASANGPSPFATSHVAPSRASVVPHSKFEAGINLATTPQYTSINPVVDAGAAYARTPIAAVPPQFQNAVAVDSLPVSFEGAWKCVTVVVDSAVDTVPVGERVESQVAFVPQYDGRIVARWNQTGWTEAHANINTVSNVEASMERTNYYLNHGLGNGSWAARSQDHYIQIDANRIAATSSVHQYVGGRYLGEYRTRSMLYRLGGNLAMAAQ